MCLYSVIQSHLTVDSMGSEQSDAYEFSRSLNNIFMCHYSAKSHYLHVRYNLTKLYPAVPLSRL